MPGADQTVADDYYAATDRVEQRLQIAPPAAAAEEHNDDAPLNDDERGQLLDLVDQLAEPDLSPEVRMELVERMRQVRNHNALPDEDEPPNKKTEDGHGDPRVPSEPVKESIGYLTTVVMSMPIQRFMLYLMAFIARPAAPDGPGGDSFTSSLGASPAFPWVNRV